MTAPKYAKKTDTTSPEIVDALRNAGYHVWIIGLPVDLLLWHPAWGATFRCMELKTPTKGKLPVRRDREAQQAFIALTGCRVAGTPESAISALGLLPR